MANRKIELTLKYLTAPQARQRLGLTRMQFDLRMARGILPKPTHMEGNVRYFDEKWVKMARQILESAPSNQRAEA